MIIIKNFSSNLILRRLANLQFAIGMLLFIGVLIATLLGLSVGGAVMFGLLLASASFIAAPAVLRHAIPQAKPSLYITSALGITFPYNIIVLLPIMFMVSSIVHNVEGSIDLFNNFLEVI